MPRAFIGVGSNIDPERNIAQSLRLLGKKTRLIGVSTVSLTEPEGGRREQPSYFNCVAAIETDLPPAELKREVLRRIEEQLGRSRGGDRFSARTCDLDLLLYGDTAVHTQEMTLPDPHLTDRPYLVQGLLELEPDLVLPGSRLKLAETPPVAARAPLKTLYEYSTQLKKEICMAVDVEKIERLVRELLSAIGEDPAREGLMNTPRRVARSFEFLASGYSEDLTTTMGTAYFSEKTDSMVIVRDIEMYSLCEHHLLPFFDRCHIGYLAREKVAGCSKLARIVDMYARRLQIQERLTEQISHAVRDVLDAAGSA